MQKYLAKTFHGLEELLADELDAIGAVDVRVLKRAVSFQGDKEILYKANLCLRTAIAVLTPVRQFKVKNEKELYDGIKDVYWDKYFDVDQTFAVSSVVHSPYFNHSKYVALKAKDGIADYFREKTGSRPDVNVVAPDLKIDIHISNDLCTVSFDSSGEMLSKRGYREQAGEAPINEVLAAAMIMLSEWDKETPLIDPMCGSATILIEAVMLALNIAPGINRNFGFEKWKNFDAELWESVKESAKNEEKERENSPEIYGFDISNKNLRIAAQNIFKAGLGGLIKVGQADVVESKSPVEKGTVITNPPYGERLELDDITGFYKEIGNALKQGYQNHDAWIITSNVSAIKSIGLKTSKRLHLYNGSLECKFHKYELYRGTKKVKYETETSTEKQEDNTVEVPKKSKIFDRITRKED